MFFLTRLLLYNSNLNILIKLEFIKIFTKYIYQL